MKIVSPAELLMVSKFRAKMSALKLSAKMGTAENKTKATIKRFIVPPIAGWHYAPNRKPLSITIDAVGIAPSPRPIHQLVGIL
jgi:hypothetical protein